MDAHFQQQDDRTDKEKPKRVLDGLNHHRRSNSVGLHPAKVLATTASPGKKSYSDPFCGDEIPSMQGSNRSLGSVKEENCEPKISRKSSRNSSRKSSACSLDGDSSPGCRSDSNPAADRKGRKGRTQAGASSARGYSSGEYHVSSSRAKFSNNNNRKSRHAGMGPKYFSSGDVSVGLNPSPKFGARNRPSQKNSGGSSGRISSSSGDNSKSPKTSRKHHSSSDSASRRKGYSPAVFCKDDDPSYIHNSINLYLDMDVFDGSRQEVFRMAFQCPVIKYGEVGELPVLVIVSNLSAYIFKIIAPER